MTHGTTIVLTVIGRVIAFVVSLICFYLAFFLYENEDGIWQNRVEDLWVKVHDRAQITDSKFLALFNTVGGTITTLSNVIFGQRRISIQMIATSTNLSLLGCVVTMLLQDMIMVPSLVDWREYAVFLSASLLLAGFAILAIRRRTSWISLAALLPVILVIVGSLRAVVHSLHMRHFAANNAGFALGLPVFLFFSLACDVGAVWILRRMFSTLSVSLSLRQMLGIAVILITLIAMLVPVPSLIVHAIATRLFVTPATLVFGTPPSVFKDPPSSSLFNDTTYWLLDSGRMWIFSLNVTTVIYCVIPLLIVVLMVLNKVIWPLVSRLTYSVARNRILLNRRAMLSIGCLSLTIALNLEHVGIKEILKLIH